VTLDYAMNAPNDPAKCLHPQRAIQLLRRRGHSIAFFTTGLHPTIPPHYRYPSIKGSFSRKMGTHRAGLYYESGFHWRTRNRVLFFFFFLHSDKQGAGATGLWIKGRIFRGKLKNGGDSAHRFSK